MIHTLDSGTFARTCPSTVKLAADPGTLMLRAVISTAEQDRAGDIVVPAGLRNAAEYLQNPVVLWAHNSSTLPPIGTCRGLDVQPDRVIADTQFAAGVPLAEDLFRLYEQGILRGWSIGFIPLQATVLPAPRGDQARPRRRGLRIEAWDLLEYSAVPIPENPGALTVALQKGLVHDGALRAWLARVPDDPGGHWWRGGWEGKTGLGPRAADLVNRAYDHVLEAVGLLAPFLASPPPSVSPTDPFAGLLG